MVKSENEIRERIKELESILHHEETMFYDETYSRFKNDILMRAFNIESQLSALHYVLGEEYKYKHL